MPQAGCRQTAIGVAEIRLLNIREWWSDCAFVAVAPLMHYIQYPVWKVGRGH
jgi:hypothetical protein